MMIKAIHEGDLETVETILKKNANILTAAIDIEKLSNSDGKNIVFKH